MNKILFHVQMLNIPHKYSEEQDSKIKRSKTFYQFIQINSKCRWHFYQNVAVHFLSI